ncbi:MAG: DNA-binding domain-containing protein [Cyanobacteria bacterium]|nr:DNA-binding domain-containing protein [Cyanobacteriota bacterium]
MSKKDLGSQSVKKQERSLADIQAFMAAAIMRPVTLDYSMRKKWTDGQDMESIASEFVTASETLTAFERLEIYNQQYWYRVLDSFEDDFSALAAILGRRKFDRLARSYLSTYPSTSFTMRDLGCRLITFLESNHELIEPHVNLCLDTARFEWAKVVAFDEESLPPLSEADLATVNTEKLVVRVQPYMTLLHLSYPLDDYSLALDMREKQQSEASSGRREAKESHKKVALPEQEDVHLVVHRHNNMLYYKRLEPPAFLLLKALRDGRPLGEACADLVSIYEEQNAEVQQLSTDVSQWFATWMRLRWLCRAN